MSWELWSRSSESWALNPWELASRWKCHLHTHSVLGQTFPNHRDDECSILPIYLIVLRAFWLIPDSEKGQFMKQTYSTTTRTRTTVEKQMVLVRVQLKELIVTYYVSREMDFYLSLSRLSGLEFKPKFLESFSNWGSHCSLFSRIDRPRQRQQ